MVRNPVELSLQAKLAEEYNAISEFADRLSRNYFDLYIYFMFKNNYSILKTDRYKTIQSYNNKELQKLATDIQTFLPQIVVVGGQSRFF